MKVLAIGDIHGFHYWDLIIKKENPEKIIFMGDYLDSFYYEGISQLNNLKKIIDYKKSNSDKVVLLLGNHDFHYLKCATSMNEVYSGFQSSMMYQFQFLLEENIDLFQMCYYISHNKDYIFSHAGVSDVWLNNNNILNKNIKTVCYEINDLFKYQPRKFAFTGKDSYGDSPESSPIWIRPRSLMKTNKNTFLHKNSIQIVGHTPQNQIDIMGKSTGGKYYFIDTLNTSGEYLVIDTDNNEFISDKLNNTEMY